MLVLVTGGAGYIGSTLVPLLLTRGLQVTVLDSLEHGADGLRCGSQTPGLRLVQGDVRDLDVLRQAAVGAEAILHLAAVSGYPACARYPEKASQVNVQGTANAVVAADGRLPVILASTLSCYGSVPAGFCDEDTLPRPVSHYGRTKLEAEALVLASLRGIVLRLATVYGVSPRLRLDLLLNDFVHTLAQGQALEVYEPEARRAFVHVRDAANAFLFALDRALYSSKRPSLQRGRREPESQQAAAGGAHPPTLPRGTGEICRDRPGRGSARLCRIVRPLPSRGIPH